MCDLTNTINPANMQYGNLLKWTDYGEKIRLV